MNETTKRSNKKVYIALAVCIVLAVAVIVSITAYIRGDRFIYREFITTDDKIVYTEDDLDALSEDDEVYLFVEDVELTDGHFFGYLLNKDKKDDEDLMIRISMDETGMWYNYFEEDKMIVHGSFIDRKKETVGLSRETYYQFACDEFADIKKDKVRSIVQAQLVSDEDELKVGDIVSVQLAIPNNPKDVQSIVYDDQDCLVYDYISFNQEYDEDKQRYARKTDKKFIFTEPTTMLSDLSVNTSSESLNDKRKELFSETFSLEDFGILGTPVLINMQVAEIINESEEDIYVLKYKETGKYLMGAFWYTGVEANCNIAEVISHKDLVEEFNFEEYDDPEVKLLYEIYMNPDNEKAAKDWDKYEKDKKALEASVEEEVAPVANSSDTSNDDYSSYGYDEYYGYPTSGGTLEITSYGSELMEGILYPSEDDYYNKTNGVYAFFSFMGDGLSIPEVGDVINLSSYYIEDVWYDGDVQKTTLNITDFRWLF